MENLIELGGLRKSFGGKIVLDGIDLAVPAGTVLGYVGPNGAGKTTTVKILTGMLSSFSGEVRVAGHDPRLQPTEVKRRIGYVPENAPLYEALTCDEYLFFVGRMHGLGESVIEARAVQMLEALGLASRRHSRIGSFSKGMRQKLLLCCALIHDPEVLFLDEPLNGLDVESTILVKELVSGLAREGKTVFYCSHMMDVVERVCDRIAILSDGRVVADGSFSELQARSEGGSLEKIFVQLTRQSDAVDRAAAFLQALSPDA